MLLEMLKAYGLPGRALKFLGYALFWAKPEYS